MSDVPATTVSALLNQPTQLRRLHIAVMLICGVGFGLDLAEVVLASGLSAVFSAPPYSLSPKTLGLLLGAPYAGAALGAPLFGWLATRNGPAKTLYLCLIVLAITSAVSAICGLPDQLSFMRFLGGIALGGYPPLMAALLVNSAPPQLRGGLIFGACGIGYLIAPAALFLLRWLTATQPFGFEGWRTLFAGLALLILASVALLRFIPEAPAWLELHGKVEAAASSISRYQRSRPAPAIVAKYLTGASKADNQPGAGADTPIIRVMLFAMFALFPLAAVGFPIVTGPMLLSRGLSLNASLLASAVAALGPAVGAFTIGMLLGRTKRWFAVSASALVMLTCSLAFGLSTAAPLLLGSVLIFGVFSSLMVAALFFDTSESLAPGRRALIMGLAFGLSRVVAALTPLLLLPSARAGQERTVLGIIDGSLVAILLLATLAHNLLSRGQHRAPPR